MDWRYSAKPGNTCTCSDLRVFSSPFAFMGQGRLKAVCRYHTLATTSTSPTLTQTPPPPPASDTASTSFLQPSRPQQYFSSRCRHRSSPHNCPSPPDTSSHRFPSPNTHSLRSLLPLLLRPSSAPSCQPHVSPCPRSSKYPHHRLQPIVLRCVSSVASSKFVPHVATVTNSPSPRARLSRCLAFSARSGLRHLLMRGLTPVEDCSFAAPHLCVAHNCSLFSSQHCRCFSRDLLSLHLTMFAAAPLVPINPKVNPLRSSATSYDNKTACMTRRQESHQQSHFRRFDTGR